MNRILALCAVLLAVVGCASQEELAQQQAARREAYIAAMDRQCRAYGFTPGTPQYGNCRMQLDMQNQALSQANAARQDAANQALINNGLTTMRGQQPGTVTCQHTRTSSITATTTCD